MLRPNRTVVVLASILAALAVSCQRAKSKSKSKSGATTTEIDSKDILARDPVAEEVDVKHILIGWKDLADVYGGRMDPRAKDRTQLDAAKLATELADKLRAKPDSIDTLVKEHSEDPGSLTGNPYSVTPAAGFVDEFKKLALRLNPREVGIVKTQFGYHVMERLAPPPPDPLESADILARPARSDTRWVLHILIGWKDVPAARRQPLDPRAGARSKEDADKLAADLLAKVRGGADMLALMKEHSEDPGSNQNGQPYEVSPDAGLVPPFKDLSMRLELGEAGLVKTIFGWHIIKRIPPPPPDPLESAEILAREPRADDVSVKHILLGWKDANMGDPRAAERDRPALDALVAKTLARIAKGESFEKLMGELSEDPRSAKSGMAYPVSASMHQVPPTFRNLALRLDLGEIGVVKTQVGFHIVKRVEPAPPAPPPGAPGGAAPPPPKPSSGGTTP